MTLQITKEGHQVLIVLENTPDNISPNWFDSHFWNKQNKVVGRSKGRFITWFIKPDRASEIMVLRHYYRGGMVSKFNTDSFFYISLNRTRCYMELILLQEMLRLKLPVPRPVGARVTRKGLFYKADLLMEKLHGIDLVDALTTEFLNEEVWRKIGQVIKKFHEIGIDHVDLNARNILLNTSGDIYLIDFDRCRKRPPQRNWQNSNLSRLKRSFIKEKEIDPTFNFQAANWDSLIGGYNK